MIIIGSEEIKRVASKERGRDVFRRGYWLWRLLKI